jgi:hypothetical protein
MSNLFVTVLPWSSTLRIVDLVLFDPRYKLRVALAILDLSHLDDVNLFPTRQSIITFLLNLPPSSFSPALLLPTVFTIKVRDERVRKATKRAEAVIRTSRA